MKPISLHPDAKKILESFQDRLSAPDPATGKPIALAPKLLPLLMHLERILLSDEVRDAHIFPMNSIVRLNTLCDILEGAAHGGKIRGVENTHLNALSRTLKNSVLEETVHQIRRQIGGRMRDRIHPENAAFFGRLSDSIAHQWERNLILAVEKLLVVVNEKKPFEITPGWIEKNAEELYDRLVHLLQAADDERWASVLRLLPPRVRALCRFDPEELEKNWRKVQETVETYRQIFEHFPELAPDFLFHQHRRLANNHSHAQHILQRYLGVFHTAQGRTRNINVLPVTVLEHPSIFRMVSLLLRKQVYQEVKEFFEQPLPPEGLTDDLLKLREEKINASIDRIIHPPGLDDEHRPLADLLGEELQKWFQGILKLSKKGPVRMNSLIHSKDGNTYSLSLRQLIAVYDFLHPEENEGSLKGKLVAFPPGKGKTRTFFEMYERMREAGLFRKEEIDASKERPTKVLYLCPGYKLAQEVADEIRKQYRKGHTPSIGIITSRTQSVDLPRILQKEVVICTYSMLPQERRLLGDEERRRISIAQHFLRAGFDFVALDESQNVNKPGQPQTDAVRSILEGQNGQPSSVKYFAELSGTPFPNTGNDVVAGMARARQDLYRGRRVMSLKDLVRDIDVRIVRRALYEYMIVLDETDHPAVEEKEVQLTRQERRVYQSILARDLHITQKITMLLMSIMNPQLVAPRMRTHTMVDKAADQLFDFFEGTEGTDKKDSVVMFESLRRMGMMSEFPGQAQLLTFYQQVQRALLHSMRKKYGSWYDDIDFLQIDGDTGEEDRRRNLLRVQYPGLHDGIDIFVFGTIRYERQRQYESRITEAKQSVSRLSNERQVLLKAKGLDTKAHQSFLDEAERAIAQSQASLLEMVSVLKSKDLARIQNYQNGHREFSTLLQPYREQIEKDDPYHIEDIDEAGLLENIVESVLEGEEYRNLKAWCNACDSDGNIRSTFIALAQHQSDLNNSELEQQSSDRYWTNRLRDYIQEHYGEKVGKEWQNIELKVISVLEQAQGSFDVFLKSLETPENSEVKCWILRVEAMSRKKGRKCSHVILYSWLSIIGLGIDLSKVERGLFVDPGWRNADRDQGALRLSIRIGKEARIVGLQSPRSLLEGIRDHGDNKEELVERLLHGGWFTETELERIERSDLDEEVIEGVSGLSPLSPVCSEVLNLRQQLKKLEMNLHGKGEAGLRRFFQQYGSRYRALSRGTWEMSSSANQGRFLTSLLQSLEKEGESFQDILEVSLGPCVLENTYGLKFARGAKNISILSPYPEMIDDGEELLRSRRSDHPNAIRQQGDLTEITSPDDAFDLATCDIFHLVNPRERLQILQEIHRVTRPMGSLVMIIPGDSCRENEFQLIKNRFFEIGWQVREAVSGSASSLHIRKDDPYFQCRVIVAQKVNAPSEISREGIIKDFAMKSGNGKNFLASQFHTQFELNGTMFRYDPALSDIPHMKTGKEYEQTLRDARRELAPMVDRLGFDDERWDDDLLTRWLERGVQIIRDPEALSSAETDEERKKAFFLIIWKDDEDTSKASPPEALFV